MSTYVIKNGELYHYGVPGMKWGVRRDTRVLTNNRRNRKVRQLKLDYKEGNITKKEKKAGIKEANRAKKDDMRSINSQLKNAKNLKEFNAVKKNIAKQTAKEVPHATLKKGATTANKVLHGVYNLGTVSSGLLAAAMAPGMAPAVGAATAVALAVSRGEQALIQLGIDRLS